MDTNIELNKMFYNEVTDHVCECDYCKFYIDHVKDAYPMLNVFLSNLGIDIEKPHEVSLPYLDKGGQIVYPLVQYISMGRCEDSYNDKIGDIGISKASSYPNIDIDRDYFVIDINPLIFNADITDKAFMESIE